MPKAFQIIIGACGLAALGALAPPPAIETRGVPALDEGLVERLARYEDMTHNRFVDWTGDGGMIIVRSGRDTNQLFRLASPNARAEQLTRYEDPVRRGYARLGEGGDHILFLKDNSGDERFQLFLVGEDGANARQLSPPESRNSNVVVSRDGRRAAFTRAFHPDDPIWGVVVTDLVPPYETRPIFQDTGAWLVLDWSPDGRHILVNEFVDIGRSHLYAVDVETGIKLPIRTSEDDGALVKARFAHNKGEPPSIIFTSNRGSEFLTLRRYDIAGGRLISLISDLGGDISDFSIAPDGRRIALVVNRDDRHHLLFYDVETGRREAGAELSTGILTNLKFDAAGKRLGFTLNAAAQGVAPYSFDLETRALMRWTVPDDDTTRPPLAEPRLVTFPTFDRVNGAPRRLNAYYYRPSGDGPFPVVVRIHGGPEAQYLPSFSPIVQAWVNEFKIAVVAPNVRGSTGYGKSFTELDDGERREDAVKDIGALLDWIARTPELDQRRVAVTGASYGGYMTLASMIAFGERIRAGIDIVGISDFVNFLENTGRYRRDLRRREYGDERDPEVRKFLAEISPIARAGEITQPLLVAQGLNDPRVPASESEQLVAEVEAAGGDVWYVVADNEGHSFRKGANRRYLNAVMTQFLIAQFGHGSPSARSLMRNDLAPAGAPMQ